MSTAPLRYLHGFGNEFESEALAGALPQGHFSPQRPAYGLYAEKFTNTAFTVARESNRRTWFYRIRPSVSQGAYEPLAHQLLRGAPETGSTGSPNALRWSPPVLDTSSDFIDGLVTLASNGNAALQTGMAVHLFTMDKSMARRCMVNSDGELLLLVQEGTLEIRTECGLLQTEPGELVVIPRGMKFQISPGTASARGFVCENYGHNLRLPERGPVGSDGYANDRDFHTPVAAYVDDDDEFEIVCKYQGRLFRAPVNHNPFDVVAWVGTAVPYKYDLRRFNALGSITYDHPDPSIYTVLSAPSDTPGVANVDIVIFPPRWLVAEGTFRPPWFHRNVMSEFVALLYGQYDAKKVGFEPGGFSLHNSYVPHGPDADVFAAARKAALEPTRLNDTMAFMFETRYVLNPTPWALACPAMQANYRDCWRGLERRFDPRTP